MNLPVRYLAVVLFLQSLLAVLDAQAAAGLAVPVGTYLRAGSNGERESISSVGGAKVGVYRKVYHPQPVVHRAPLQPVKKKPGYPPKKPTAVSGRTAGLLSGLLGGAGGLLGGLLGRR